ncbi:TolC family protein [Paraglaciecola sp. L1A13]|uniref:TolC family protein n=1 Tax=Paraglaciecola sp. L1A13 TaxID=2686359 RepID=UPI00131C2125|nr:TolC family protein [Paraglaciecola sp. L1A13]
MKLANVISRKQSTARSTVRTLLTCGVLVISAQTWAGNLQQAVLQAQQNDPWLVGSTQKEHALKAQGAAADTLPNPEFSLGLLSVPSDGFALNQEPMTQLKVGVKQTLTRGDSRTISRQRYNELAAQQPLLRQDRLAIVKRNVTSLWMDLYSAKQSIALSMQQRTVLSQLIDIAQTNYAAVYTSGQKRGTQSDVLEVQLSIAKLDDRISALRTLQRTAQANLCRWLAVEPNNNDDFRSVEEQAVIQTCEIDKADGSVLPVLAPLPELLKAEKLNHQAIAQILIAHPRVKAFHQAIVASSSDVRLAKAQYGPKWGVNASYAYRQDDDFNRSRADFWSVGVSVDFPIFSTKKQDNLLAVSHHQKESLRTDYRLLLREMLAELDSLHGQYAQITQRIQHYDEVILSNIAEQKEVSIANFSHDYSSLSQATEVAVIELDAQLEQLKLINQQYKIKAQIAYFLPTQTSTNQALSSRQNSPSNTLGDVRHLVPHQESHP